MRGLVIGVLALCVTPCELTLRLPASYAEKLYGGGDRAARSAADVDVVWYNLLPWTQRIKLLPWNVFATECWYDWTWPTAHRPQCLLVARRVGVHAAAPAHAWAEVTHGGTTEHVGRGYVEASAAWFYLARGSGVWIHTGRTAVFATHASAVQAVLNRTCHDVIWKDRGSLVGNCLPYFAALFEALRAMKYDSVQFVHHCDTRCGCTSTELVIIRPGVAGVPGCPTNVTVRAGANASRTCTCDESKPFLNCDGDFAWD